MRYALILSLTLAACETVVPQPKPRISEDSCGAKDMQYLVGQSVDVLAAMTFPASRPMRIIRPGMAVTMDYSPERLNMDIDKKNRIARIWCG